MATLFTPLFTRVLDTCLPSPSVGSTAPLSIQLDEQFALMAERYFDNIYDGRTPMPAQLKKLIEKHGCKAHQADAPAHDATAPHRRFIEAMDEIARTPNAADAIIDKHFHGLTNEERAVLKQNAKAPSTEVHAKAVGMSKELFIQRLESSMYKFKPS